MTIDEIAEQLHIAENEFTQFCYSITDEQFFHQPQNKWSPAQQVKHLIIATDTSLLAYSLPKFIVRLVGGKPNRKSRTYDELVAKYKLKLEQGGRASKRFIPRPISASYGKEKLLKQLTRAMNKFSATLKSKWTESKLEEYISPHPLLGKITLKELCYFTIYHTQHHLHNIRLLIQAAKPS